MMFFIIFMFWIVFCILLALLQNYDSHKDADYWQQKIEQKKHEMEMRRREHKEAMEAINRVIRGDF